MKGKHLSTLLLLASAIGVNGAAQAQTVRGLGHPQKSSIEATDRVPNGKGWGEPDRNVVPATTSGGKNGISYHGGKVMLGTSHIYYIWYGNWGEAAQSILLNLASSIGGTRYFNINTTYYNAAKAHVSKYTTYHGSAADHYSKGTRLNDAAVQAVVAKTISSGRLPKDSNGVYFVLTSRDVKETSGFCTAYCGWHSHATIDGTDIKFAFVGDASQQCPSACEQQISRSPNGHPGADGMASVIAHELSESVTDPDLNAWYDGNGEENADKCAWGFGAMKTASNASKYNITLGGRDYLIQRNWVNANGGYCAMGY
jgi:hypothetical protein